MIETPCTDCGGTGVNRKTVKIKIDIPAGVDTDSIVTVRGQGEPGINGGPDGDLYIVVNVRPHSTYKRRGDDLYLEMPITFDVAALGGKVQVPGFGESYSYTITPGTQTGSSFRLKGKGVPVLGADTTVALGGRIFGKPKDLAEAADMLAALQGRTHSVWTGVCIAKNAGAKTEFKCASMESKVSFKKLGYGEIAEYLRRVNALDKAGAYAAQECGEMIIEKIEGDFDNVMGLPMRLVKNLLDTADF